mmetsp:Transcript_34708/g.91692  ORF Transcript_34708/g.91692 Transcript_34708/m.91692 type:complete len:343 (-) Transcript_34708:58-1086(-)
MVRHGQEDMHPLLKQRLHVPRTVFAPGSRVVMNIIPMLLNIFVPWGVFTFCHGLTSFWTMYHESHLVWSLLTLVFAVWLALLVMAIFARRGIAEPTWFTYITWAYGAAAFAGCLCGIGNYVEYTRPYYAIQDLKVAHQVDAGRELGQDLMDAGILYFAHNNHLDISRSWHFKHRTLYCVAPVITNGTSPLTHSYDFWAVGEGCCSTASADFRCGPDWSSATTRSGLRVLDDQVLANYRLAVKQAETLYGIVATHPIFFTWSEDPLTEVNNWNAQAYHNYIFMVVFTFVVSLFFVMVATCNYAWMGRAASAYAVDFYSDPDWKTANMARPVASATRSYSAASV